MKRIFFGFYSDKYKLLLRVVSIVWWIFLALIFVDEFEATADSFVLFFLLSSIPIALSFVLSFFVDSIAHFLPYIISLFILTPIVSWQTSYNKQDYMKSLDYHVVDGWMDNFSFFYTLLIVVFAYSIINYKALTKK